MAYLNITAKGDLSKHDLHNLWGVCFVILWTALSRLFEVDRQGRFITIGVLFLFLYNLKNKEWKNALLSKPIVIWGVWCVFSSINLLVQGYTPYINPEGDLAVFVPEMFFFQTILRQLVILTTVCYLYKKDDRVVLRLLILSYICISVLSMLFDSVNDSWGTDVRFGAKIGNSGSLMMIAAMFMICLAWIKEYMPLRKIIMYSAVALALVVMIQTRKALVAILIIFVFTYFAKLKRVNIETLFVSLLLLIAVNYGQDFLASTDFGARFMSIEESGSEHNQTGIPMLDWLGDRALHVYLGWNIWMDNPIFGVGLKNAPSLSGLPFVFHQEYIGELAENGIIGFSLLLYFYYNIMRRLLRVMGNRSDKSVYWICFGGISAILFISLTTWTYEFPQYFVIYAIVIAEIQMAEARDKVW